MGADTRGCGPLYDLYAAARADDPERIRAVWERFDLVVANDDHAADRLEAAVDDGATETVEVLARDLLYVDEETTELDGPLASLVSAVLYAFGYVASFVLFFGASSRREVVDRLRWAYRRVGVRIQDTESIEGTERTVFRCPYRNLGAARYGERRVCHDVLDRVDDGYVTALERHWGIDYDRPRRCAGSACCHSEVEEL
jgi:hypothetical protein